MTNHVPVLLQETIEFLKIKPNKNYIDATFGAGGHTKEILKKNKPNGKVLALDIDYSINSEELKKEFNKRFILKQTNFNNLKNTVKNLSPTYKFHGILFDLGVSTMQLSDPKRGFSFKNNSLLDMRLTGLPDLNFTSLSKIYPSLQILRENTKKDFLAAYHLVNFLTETALVKIFQEFGEERFAKPIAKAIAKKQKNQMIKTTQELVCIIESVKKPRYGKIHPATKIFQALRIAVNDELENLKQGLVQSLEILEPKSRIAVISFHSLEDRIVKSFFKENAKQCLCSSQIPFCLCKNQAKLKIITKKPITPTQKELSENPRSRSAKMRVAELV